MALMRRLTSAVAVLAIRKRLQYDDRYRSAGKAADTMCSDET